MMVLFLFLVWFVFFWVRCVVALAFCCCLLFFVVLFTCGLDFLSSWCEVVLFVCLLVGLFLGFVSGVSAECCLISC